METEKKTVGVFTDRAYTIVRVNNGKLEYENYSTSTLGNTIDFLHALEEVEGKNALCFAACYKMYEGSFNVEVDVKAQHDVVLQWANERYKTFAQKYVES